MLTSCIKAEAIALVGRLYGTQRTWVADANFLAARLTELASRVLLRLWVRPRLLVVLPDLGTNDGRRWIGGIRLQLKIENLCHCSFGCDVVALLTHLFRHLGCQAL